MPSSVLKATFAEQLLCDRHSSSRVVPRYPREVGISPFHRGRNCGQGFLRPPSGCLRAGCGPLCPSQARVWPLHAPGSREHRRGSGQMHEEFGKE